MIPRGKPRDRVSPEELQEICEVLMDELFVKQDVIMARYNVAASVVRAAARRCRSYDGLDRETRRKEAILDFFRRRPHATNKEAAAELGISSDDAVYYYKKRYCPSLTEAKRRQVQLSAAFERCAAIAKARGDLRGEALLLYVADRFRVDSTDLKRKLLVDSHIANEARVRYFEPMTPEEERDLLAKVDRHAQKMKGVKQAYRVTIDLPNTTRNQELKYLIAVKYEAGSFASFCAARISEYIFYAERVIRPEWYVADVASRGYPGISLPEECFARYLELYEHKRARIGEYVAEEEDERQD